MKFPTKAAKATDAARLAHPLKVLRDWKNLTLQEVLDQTGIGIVDQCRIEWNDRRLKWWEGLLLADFYGVDPDDLFTAIGQWHRLVQLKARDGSFFEFGASVFTDPERVDETVREYDVAWLKRALRVLEKERRFTQPGGLKEKE